jgi:glycosyltransferase involved in cell wall biosynthesis
MIENTIVHVLNKSIFAFLDKEDRIVGHGKLLSKENFLEILGSMDLNLYMSFNESWGLVAKESEAMGVKTISNLNINYINAMRLKLDK